MKTGIFSKDEAHAAFKDVKIFAFYPGDFCVQSHDQFSFRTLNFINSCRVSGRRIYSFAAFLDAGARKKLLQRLHWSKRTGDLRKGGVHPDKKARFLHRLESCRKGRCRQNAGTA